MRRIHRFIADKKGTFAVTFAISSVALAAFVGIGIDTYRTQSAKIAITQVVTRTCERIQSNAGTTTQNSSDVIAQAKQFAAGQQTQSLANASYGVTNSGTTYTVTGSSVVPVTFMAVVGAKDVAVSATSTCDSANTPSNQCVNAIFSQNSPLDITLKNGFLTQVHQQSSGGTQTTSIKTGLSSGQDYVVSLIKDDQPPTTYYRGSYGGDYSGSFTISSSGAIGAFGSSPTGGITVTGTDILYIQPLNSDGSIPAICASTVTAPASTSSSSSTPSSSSGSKPPKGSCGPDYNGYSGQSPTKSLYNSSNFVSSDQFSYGSDATVNGSSVMPLASDYEANTTSINVNGVSSSGSSVTFNSTYQDLYVHNMMNQNAANLANLKSGPNWLAYVRGPTSGIWIDANGNCTEYESPIVLDLAGLGRIVTTGETTAQFGKRSHIGRTVRFDLFGDGKPVAVEWLTGNGQGFLVDNRDGRAVTNMDGKRLFGNVDGFDDGYAKLEQFDHSETGVLQGDDLNGLAVWLDDGSATPNEANVVPVRKLGITQISVRPSREDDGQGNMLLRSWATVNGKRIITEDVWLGIAR